MSKVIHIKTLTPNELTTGKGATFTDENGVDIPGVKSAKIELAYDKATTAELTLYSSFAVDAKAKFVMYNPNTGKLAEIHRVLFADDSVWEAIPISDATVCSTEGRARVFVKGNGVEEDGK